MKKSSELLKALVALIVLSILSSVNALDPHRGDVTTTLAIGEDNSANLLLSRNRLQHR